MIVLFSALPAHAAAPPRLRVALLPLERVNVGPEQARRYERLLRQTLGQRTTVTIIDVAAAAPASQPSSRPASQPSSRPASRPTDLRRLGQQLGADRLLRLRVGQLGDTTIIRLTVFDVAKGARQGSWQEVLRSPDDQLVARAMERMVSSFAPLPPPDRPWYTRWWVWTAAGVVVAGTVTAIVVTSLNGGADPNKVITPP